MGMANTANSTAVIKQPTRPAAMSIIRFSHSCTGVAQFMPVVRTI